MSDEKDHRAKLSGFETKSFNALIDSIVRNNIIQVKKQDERSKLLSREAHFRLAIQEERLAWCCVIEDLLRQYARQIVIKERSRNGEWKSVRITASKNQNQNQNPSQRNKINDNDDDDSDDAEQDAQGIFARRTHDSEERLSIGEGHRNNSNNDNRRMRHSPVTFADDVVAGDNGDNDDAEQEFIKREQYDLPTFKRRDDEDASSKVVEAVAPAESNQKRPNQQNQIKSSTIKAHALLTASTLFGASTDHQLQQKRKFYQNQKQQQANNKYSNNNKGRANPFDAIISTSSPSSALQKSTKGGVGSIPSKLPDVAKMRIDDLLLKHGERNQKGNGVVERSADKRKIELMELARSKKEAVFARSLNPTAMDMNGLF